MNRDYALSSVPSLGLPVEVNGSKIEPVKVELIEGVASGDALIGSRGVRMAVSTGLTGLHEDALLEILSRLSYEEVARLRLVVVCFVSAGSSFIDLFYCSHSSGVPVLQ